MRTAARSQIDRSSGHAELEALLDTFLVEGLLEGDIKVATGAQFFAFHRNRFLMTPSLVQLVFLECLDHRQVVSGDVLERKASTYGRLSSERHRRQQGLLVACQQLDSVRVTSEDLRITRDVVVGKLGTNELRNLS